MPDINDPNLPGALGSGSLTNPSGSVDYTEGNTQIAMSNQIDMGGDIGSWDSFDFGISNDVMSGGVVSDVANQIGQGSVNDPAKMESGSPFKSITDKLARAFEGKEGDKMIGMGVLAALNGIANHKYKEAQLKTNQQIGAAAESKERRAAENAKSAGQAFGLIGLPKSQFKPISPVPRTGG